MFDQASAWPAVTNADRRQTNVTVIYNPLSGGGNGGRLHRFLGVLKSRGAATHLRQACCFADLRPLAVQAAATPADVLAVAGGDGTIREVASGLGDGTPPLAVLPSGTANVLAAELGIPVDGRRAATALLSGTPRTVYVPTANGQRFLLMAGVGFDARIVASVSPRLKRIVGRFAYVAAFAATWWAGADTRYQVTIDGAVFEAASVVVANAHYYGGRFTCAPEARLDQPELQACLFLRGGRWHALSYGWSLLTGSLHRRRDVRILPARRVIVSGPRGEPVQCDGDILTNLPLTVEAAAARLRFIVPASAA